jgi:predicted nucleotidyltransferase
MTNAYGLPLKAIQQINAIFSQYPQIKQVILYGSRAKGNYRQGSDIDLTIEGAIELSTLLKIEQQIDDLLLPWSVDLSVLSQIDNLELVEHIKRKGQVFYQAP